jgi:hypothetical protein
MQLIIQAISILGEAPSICSRVAQGFVVRTVLGYRCAKRAACCSGNSGEVVHGNAVHLLTVASFVPKKVSGKCHVPLLCRGAALRKGLYINQSDLAKCAFETRLVSQ